MSVIQSKAVNSNPQLTTVEREQVVHAVPPPPPPPPSMYDGEDYQATRNLDSLGRGRGGTPEADLEDLEFLMEDGLADWEESPEQKIPDPSVIEEKEGGTVSESRSKASKKTALKQPAGPTPEERQEFLGEIGQAKTDFKETVAANENLTDIQKREFIQTFNERANALASATDLDKAREELSNLPTLVTDEMQASIEAAQEETKKRREALYQEMTGFTHASRFLETQGHWWQKGIELGEQFLSALQTGNWSDFKTHLSELQGNQRWVCVMRVVTAIYRTAGKDEEKTIQMLNNFVPKDVVQAMVDSVMSEPENINWGNGDKNECGPEGLVEWNIPDTSDFLRRSLEARREFDPYTASQESSTPAS